MPRQFNNKRKCKGLCENEYLYGIKVFPQKREPYSKASYCSECTKSVLPPSVQKIVVTHKGHIEEFPYKIKVRCPCCKSICRGGPLSKTKPKVKPEYLKSYKEWGLSKTPTRFKSELKQGLNRFLEDFKKFDYEMKLYILKQYDEGGIADKNGLFEHPYDEFKDLLGEAKDDKQRQLYVRKFLKLLDKFARKYKLGLDGLTEEELKKEAQKSLNEAIRRHTEIGPNGRYTYRFPLYDKEGNELTEEQASRVKNDRI